MNPIATEEKKDMVFEKLKETISEFFRLQTASDFIEDFNILSNAIFNNPEYYEDYKIELNFRIMKLCSFLSKLERTHYKKFQNDALEELHPDPTNLDFLEAMDSDNNQMPF
ncbi:MAG: hypothetical protein MUC49_15130 [Raineya sp.]|jgi:hypothetical protein|nr:hypothetical protein [Raineya sp.]